MSKIVWVLRIGDYRPDLCRFTIPTIRAWAAKIGAEYREITHRMFNDRLPITYEKLQIHPLGMHAKWNILVDADVMIHPEMPDPTQMFGPDTVLSSYGFDASKFFEMDKYFMRDGRNRGIAGGFVVTSHLTHDLWSCSELSVEQLLERSRRWFILDEYVISRNLARYGLKYSGVLPPDQVDEKIVHLGNEAQTDSEKAASARRAEKLFLEWALTYPNYWIKHRLGD